METYPIKNSEGIVYAFEIENVYISLRGLSSVFSSIKKISGINTRKIFKLSAEAQIEFEYGGEKYIVWEPFGDNSRYWVGPKDDGNRSLDISEIEHAFKQYHPFILRKIAGDLLSLKFFKKKEKGQV